MTNEILFLGTDSKEKADWSISGIARYPLNSGHSYYENSKRVFETVQKHIEKNKTPYFGIGHYFKGELEQEPFYHILIDRVYQEGHVFVFLYRSFRCSNRPSKEILKYKNFANSLITAVEYDMLKDTIKKEMWKKIVFIGSSSESKETAGKIAAILQEKYGENLAIRPWWKEFEPRDITFNKLFDIAEKVDKAIFVLSDDDVVDSRNVEQPAPRDNVILEYGLFLGKLGRENVDICCKNGVKTPTDISGLTVIRYSGEVDGDFAAIDKISRLY